MNEIKSSSPCEFDVLSYVFFNSGGGRGNYGGGRRDNYRDGGSGPDRNYHGGNRSRPY